MSERIHCKAKVNTHTGMKSVLMIAYYFPPEGSAGVYRSLRFVRQLAKIGWAPAIITADPYRYERYDPKLLALLPGGFEIIRIRGRDPWQAMQSWRAKGIERKFGASSAPIAQPRIGSNESLRSRIRAAVRTIEAWYYYPDMARPWIRPAIGRVVEFLPASGLMFFGRLQGPVSAWIVAQKASEHTGVPYVLDLRDPHGLGYYESENKWPGWAKRKVYVAMHRAFKNARAVVFLFESVAECYLRAFPGALDPKRVHIIPNGYEGEIEETAPPKGDRCSVLYSGTISTYRYDTLLQSLVLLKDKYPEQGKRLQLQFVGEGSDAVLKEAARLGISELVETSAPVPQSKIPALQRAAHALLLLGRPPTMKGYELVVGAKLFEYLKARRPIIGVLPDDEGKRILLRLGLTTVADVDSRGNR